MILPKIPIPLHDPTRPAPWSAPVLRFFRRFSSLIQVPKVLINRRKVVHLSRCWPRFLMCATPKCHLLASLFVPLFCNSLGAEPRASVNYTLTPETNDSGGGRSTSAFYSFDSSTGSPGGSSLATPALLLGKSGYSGQLYDVTGLALSANPATIPESGTRQLVAYAALDDATFLTLDASNVAWGVVSGPLAGIDAAGLVTAATVPQDTGAVAQGAWRGFTATLGFTVLNSSSYNYADDNIDDAWQTTYFGNANPLAAPAEDPDGDGQTNSFEFIAGLNPTARASLFLTQIIPVAGQASQRKIVFQPVIVGRTYTVVTSSSLTSTSWIPLPGSPPAVDNGDQRTVTDSGATEARKFYCVKITKP